MRQQGCAPRGSTVFHVTCTCKTGPDGMAVVDDRLRVIDASVMPTDTSTNTNASTIMIAEKGAFCCFRRRAHWHCGTGPALPIAVRARARR